MIDMEKFPALKSLNRFIITFFFVLGVTFSMVTPFSVVYADGAQFAVSENGASVFLGFSMSNRYNQTFASANNSICYFIYVFSAKASSTNNYYDRCEVAICPDTDYYYKGANNSNSRESLTYSQEYGFYYKVNKGSETYQYVSGTNYLINSNLNSMTTNEILEYVLPYYQESVGPVIDYGDIKDLSYSTSIVGSGTTTGDANIDTISWYPYWDTNSNISTTWNMEIQVVPGTWQGGTNTDIFSQSYQDFIINESGATSIYHGTYLNGSYSISWGEVKNKLSILSWADLFQYFDGTYWNKKGWVYRARFNDPDSGYWSDWQTVYTVTSSDGEGVENFIDPSDGTGLPDFYNNAVNSYNTTSVVNNNNNITYYYVNTPVDTNPSSDDSTQYLKEIRDTIIQIRRMIAIDNNSDTNINNDNDPWVGNPAAELYNFEDSSINDLNDAVSDLPTSDLLQGNKFLNAAGWVRTQYELLVLSTPFEGLIVFSLLLGFGLLLIGKLR